MTDTQTTLETLLVGRERARNRWTSGHLMSLSAVNGTVSMCALGCLLPGWIVTHYHAGPRAVVLNEANQWLNEECTAVHDLAEAARQLWPKDAACIDRSPVDSPLDVDTRLVIAVNDQDYDLVFGGGRQRAVLKMYDRAIENVRKRNREVAHIEAVPEFALATSGD